MTYPTPSHPTTPWHRFHDLPHSTMMWISWSTPPHLWKILGIPSLEFMGWITESPFRETTKHESALHDWVGGFGDSPKLITLLFLLVLATPTWMSFFASVEIRICRPKHLTNGELIFRSHSNYVTYKAKIVTFSLKWTKINTNWGKTYE